MSEDGSRDSKGPDGGIWDVHVESGDDEAARYAAAKVKEIAAESIAERGVFTFAVSGGRTPWIMFRHLADMEMPWESTRIFQVDERVADAQDPARNLRHLIEALDGAPADIVAMPVELIDLSAAAQDYAGKLPGRFDLIHLGLGPDGHTASLVPDDPILDVRNVLVAVTTNTYQGHRRMSLTYPALDSARCILWLVTGAEKNVALTRLLDHDRSIPAGQVAAADNLVICDRDAYSGGVDAS